MRIKNYRDAHSEEEIFSRQNSKGNRVHPWQKVGRNSWNPGDTAWSPHLYQDGRHTDRWGRDVHDAALLKPGDMVYARCEFDKKTGNINSVKDLFPVMISRELYANSPTDLLDCSLKPAKAKNKLSPADRLFGWVPQKQGDDAGYKGRIRVVCDNEPRPEIIEKFNGKLPLTILGQPKPAQGRFYVADDQGAPQHNVEKKKAGYDVSQGKNLRGRKQYWHHKGLEAHKESEEPAQDYWKPTVEGSNTRTK